MGIEGSEIKKLYIRLPVKIKDEVVIKDLHPNIIKVHLPRQKTRWCVVDFKNKEDLKKAVEDLKKVKINNKSIKIKAHKRGPIRKVKNVSVQEVKSNKSLENLLKQK